MDSEKKLIKLSITDLVLFNRSGDLATDDMHSDPQEGIRGHQKIQKSRTAPYQGEVYVSKKLSSQSFELDLSGRIDGVLPLSVGTKDQLLAPLTGTVDLFSSVDPSATESPPYLSPLSSHTIIEEIKTHRQPLAQLSNDKKTGHLEQAKHYAYLWASQHDLQKIIIQITYYNVQDESLNFCRHQYTLVELEQFFITQTKAYIEFMEHYYQCQNKRNSSLKTLTFPFKTFRSNQRLMAKQVYLASSYQKPLVVEAPTGSGKTMAVLFSALKALAHHKVTHLYFLTAKNSGVGAVQKSFALLYQQDIHLCIIHWVGKEKLCPLMAQCDGFNCPFSQGYYDRLKLARSEVFQSQFIDATTLLAMAKKHRMCPHQLMFDLSPWADLIVADYNYFFDPAINRLEDKKTIKPLLLIDESHNLIERVRQLYSASITIKQLENAVKIAPRQVKTSLKMIIGACYDICEKQPRNPPLLITEPLKQGLEHFSLAWSQYCSVTQQAQIHQQLMNISHQLYRVGVIEKYLGQQYQLIIDGEKPGFTLNYWCLDPGHFIDHRYSNTAMVLFSATLSPIKDYQHLLLGAAPHKTMQLPPVFNAKKQCTLIVPYINVRYQSRRKSQTELIELIYSVLDARPGNYLIFFPSYQYLDLIYQNFSEQYPNITTVRQHRNMTLGQQSDFIQAFSAASCDQPGRMSKGNLLGFALLGGIVGESIDLPGESLIGVIVVSVNLSEKNRYNEAIKMYYQKNNQSGYHFAYRLPGMNRVLQACGRVIRTQQDKGIVCLVDERFSDREYSRLLPAYWPKQRVNCLNDLQNVLEKFWHKDEIL